MHTLVLTLYPNNVTLNNNATSYFKNVRRAMIGLDKDSLKSEVRSATKREIDLHLVSMDQLHKVSVGEGHAGVSNGTVIEEISGMINQPIDGLRVNAAHDEMEDIPVVDLHELATDKG